MKKLYWLLFTIGGIVLSFFIWCFFIPFQFEWVIHPNQIKPLSPNQTYNLANTATVSLLPPHNGIDFSAFQLPNAQYYQLSWWVNYDFSKAGISFYGIFENMLGQTSYVRYLGENLQHERDEMLARHGWDFDGKLRYSAQFSLDPSGSFDYEHFPCDWFAFQKSCFFAGKQKGRFILFANPDSPELFVDIAWS